MKVDPYDHPELVTALADELRVSPPAVLWLDPTDALVVVGNLQLALRHPQNDSSTATVRRVVDAIAGHFGPAFQRTVELGYGDENPERTESPLGAQP